MVVKLYIFLTSALDEGEWGTGFDALSSGDRASSTLWVCPRAGLGTVADREMPDTGGHGTPISQLSD
jgi:hypothetical protein